MKYSNIILISAILFFIYSCEDIVDNTEDSNDLNDSIDSIANVIVDVTDSIVDITDSIVDITDSIVDITDSIVDITDSIIDVPDSITNESLLELFKDSLINGGIDENNIYAFNYNDRGYFFIKEEKTWEEAAAIANSVGGYLAEINSQEEQDTIQSVIEINPLNIVIEDNPIANPSPSNSRDGGGTYMWIGGNDIDTEGSWVWNGNNDSEVTNFFDGVYFNDLLNNGKGVVNNLYNNFGGRDLSGNGVILREPDNTDINGQDQDALGINIGDNGWPVGYKGQWNDLFKTNTLFYIIEKELIE